MSSDVICILPSMFGQLFVYTQMTPLLIGMAFAGFTYLTGSLVFAFMSCFLFVLSYFLWPIQQYMNQTRSPYLCPIGSAAYEFPAIEVVYVTAIVTMVVFYAIFYRGRPGVFAWIGLFLLFAIPAFVLCFFQFNTWSEVLISAAISAVLTSIFMVHLWLFIGPSIPYLECLPPFSTFQYSDDMGWLWNQHKYPYYWKYRCGIHDALNVHVDRWKPKRMPSTTEGGAY